jgi:hypothetical protein
MQFPHLQRLAEIQSRLKPLLEELGIKAKYDRNDEGDLWVLFENRDGSIYSPVAVLPEDKTGVGNAWMTSYEMFALPGSHNGWFFYDIDEAKIKDVDLPEDVDRAFELLEQTIRAAGVIVKPNGRNKVTTNLLVPDTFSTINKAFFAKREASGFMPTIKLSRKDGNEVMEFRDQLKVKWSIVFDAEKYTCTPYANGVQTGPVSRLWKTEMAEFIEAASWWGLVDGAPDYGWVKYYAAEDKRELGL